MNSRSQLLTSSPPKFRTYPLPTSTQHMRVSNKATALRELQRSQLMHVDKLRKMKPSIDMCSPKQYPHVQYNAKRMQMEAERNLAIERENKILLGKMYSIMNAEPAYKTHKVTVTSLNMTVRKQEYDRIARENQAIMQRILQRDSEFNSAKLDEDWKVTQRYLRNISEYPFILGHLPPATRRRSLKPLKPGGAEDLQVQLSMEVVDGEVVTQTVVISQIEERAKAAAAEAERLEAARAEAAA
eukprot:CAMPEP_0119090816 /NCGR_PEP_ID=MMETSP1178-20130426/154079_1 /TAXON_ID=33656 /ORGANISM="unid sp, Strain CCMP2000" /LENGTH=241 /DNA_ID=CAMNT_0007074271 /DNA_START=29 /DNA_END=750 /DNA_ORIENTATION=+